MDESLQIERYSVYWLLLKILQTILDIEKFNCTHIWICSNQNRYKQYTYLFQWHSINLDGTPQPTLYSWTLISNFEFLGLDINLFIFRPEHEILDPSHLSNLKDLKL